MVNVVWEEHAKTIFVRMFSAEWAGFVTQQAENVWTIHVCLCTAPPTKHAAKANALENVKASPVPQELFALVERACKTIVTTEVVLVGNFVERMHASLIVAKRHLALPMNFADLELA